ncbi:MAG: hypothetical protein RIR12_2354 [Bacteroidota bacterium]|jgi:hypothetical protein
MKTLFERPEIGEELLANNLTNWEKHFSKPQLYILIENPYYTENFSIFNNLNLLPSGGTTNCTCRYNISCGLLGYCDGDAKCTEIHSCGMFGGSACTGLCD